MAEANHESDALCSIVFRLCDLQQVDITVLMSLSNVTCKLHRHRAATGVELLHKLKDCQMQQQLATEILCYWWNKGKTSAAPCQHTEN